MTTTTTIYASVRGGPWRRMILRHGRPTILGCARGRSSSQSEEVDEFFIEDDAAPRGLSGLHCTIWPHPNMINIMDGAGKGDAYAPSTRGTVVDGQVLVPKQWRQLAEHAWAHTVLLIPGDVKPPRELPAFRSHGATAMISILGTVEKVEVQLHPLPFNYFEMIYDRDRMLVKATRVAGYSCIVRLEAVRRRPTIIHARLASHVDVSTLLVSANYVPDVSQLLGAWVRAPCGCCDAGACNGIVFYRKSTNCVVVEWKNHLHTQDGATVSVDDIPQMVDEYNSYDPYADSNDPDEGEGEEGEGEGEEEEDTINWACCDKCGKWRRLPAGEEYGAEALGDGEWFCTMNPDGRRNTCQKPVERFEDEGEVVM